MTQKIWVIEDPGQELVSKKRRVNRVAPSVQQDGTLKKNPALAFSLSLVIWGAGQFYNRQWKVGILFSLQMIHFYLSIYLLFHYWENMKTLFELFLIRNANVLLTFLIICFSGLIIWYINSWQAYFMSIKINSQPFSGIKNKFLPTICSIMICGWGQCLNGQTKKSLLYLSVALVSFGACASSLIIYRLWPTLESSHARNILEWIFTICVISTPLTLVIWLSSILDAAKISMNSFKKEPVRKKIKYTVKKLRHRILFYDRKYVFIHQIKRISFFMLLIILCVFISYNYFPKYFYLNMMQNVETNLLERDMTVLPDLINRVVYKINKEN